MVRSENRETRTPREAERGYVYTATYVFEIGACVAATATPTEHAPLVSLYVRDPQPCASTPIFTTPTPDNTVKTPCVQIARASACARRKTLCGAGHLQDDGPRRRAAAAAGGGRLRGGRLGGGRRLGGSLAQGRQAEVGAGVLARRAQLLLDAEQLVVPGEEWRDVDVDVDVGRHGEGWGS